MKKSKKLQFSKESVKILTEPDLDKAVGGGAGTAKCQASVDGVCTTGGLSCLIVCDTP
jgi:hypothetical protein